MNASRREFLGGLIAAGALPGAAGRLLAEDAPPRVYRACVIGHTGRGGYGHGLDTAFQKIPGVAVLAVADPDPQGREAALRKTGAARAYADFREMLEKEKPNLVSVGMRSVEERLAVLRASAEAGAHVFMEKPMAASLDEADAILEACKQRGVKIALAFHALASSRIAHLKRLLGEGLIGDLLELRSRGKEDRRAGGEDMMVLGTHCMYLMRYFAGEALWCSARVTQDGREVTRADARAATEPLGPVAGDSIHATYAFPGGIQGHFASQKCRQGPGGRFGIALFGSKGQVKVHIGMDPEIHHLPDPLWSPGKTGARWQPLPGEVPRADASGLAGQELANRTLVLGLIRAVEAGVEPMAGGEEGRAVLEMILGVYASHLEGGRVTFPLKDRRHPLGALG